MENSVAGDVAVLPFPHADLTGAKRRPALVLAVPWRFKPERVKAVEGGEFNEGCVQATAVTALGDATYEKARIDLTPAHRVV